MSGSLLPSNPDPEFTSQPEAFVHLENLSKDYGRLRALDGVSFRIGPGVTGLLGPNGAGKTTLIKVLLGLVRYTSGRGEVMGYDLARHGRQIRSCVGYMPEDDCYISGLTGIEMVQFSARLAGQPPVEGLRRAHEILDFCGMQQERYRSVDSYSTGMRQKVKFAQAIVHDPPFLILDEPTTSLDPEERQSMLNRIEILAHRQGKAVLLSTHILPDVQAVCDQVIIVARGKVQVVDSLENLSRMSSPAYHLRVVGDVQPLLERVEQEGVPVKRGEGGGLTIQSTKGALLEQIWKWSSETGVSIRSLRPARNSLEQIFLDAVRGSHRADS